MLDLIVPVVYQELRAIASRHLATRGTNGSLTTTAVVHEAYLKLADQSRAQWRDRPHFLALASLAMRHILVDRARAHGALKRAGAARLITLDEEEIPSQAPADELLQLDEALKRLAQLAPRLARVVELRFFGGMTIEEIADLFGVAPRTVERDWVKARMLLRAELEA
jgi:RNA polymerase sigma factor (TIGR02999 family)